PHPMQTIIEEIGVDLRQRVILHRRFNAVIEVVDVGEIWAHFDAIILEVGDGCRPEQRDHAGHNLSMLRRGDLRSRIGAALWHSRRTRCRYHRSGGLHRTSWGAWHEQRGFGINVIDILAAARGPPVRQPSFPLQAQAGTEYPPAPRHKWSTPPPGYPRPFPQPCRCPAQWE